MTFQQQLENGLSYHQSGRLVEAESIYRQVLEQHPESADALHLLGALLGQVGRLDVGVELIRRATRIAPQFAEAHNSLGIALKNSGKFDEAIISFRQAIRLKPDLVEAQSNLGSALTYIGLIDEAIAVCRQAIRIDPGFADGYNNLGIALKSIQEFDEAVACFREAIRLKPDLVQAYSNLGGVLMNLRQFDEAIAVCRHAVRLRPDFAEAHGNLGSALKDKKELDEAVACFREAIRLKPDFADALINLGNALGDKGEIDEAIACYRRAMRAEPDCALAHSDLVFAIQFHPGYDAKMLFEENRRWNSRFAEPLSTLAQPHSNNRDANRRLRIGYVSPDFRDHCQSLFVIPLLSNHDREAFEIICYADVRRPDTVTERVRGYADEWRSIVGMMDAEAARKIRQDRIDILIDLTMHMANGRPLVFARKPAPVQAAWLAYPGTTGLSAMDYRLTDPYLDAPGLDEEVYSETSIRLPDSFWCYDPLLMEPSVNALPAQANGFVTFGCLNNFCKVNKQVLQLWAQVLKAVDRSRLMILCPEGSHRQPIMELMQRERINSDRIELVNRRPRVQYLELYHRIDVGLDTFPYNGHTTSLDAFWMGVPVITLVGRTIVGRAGLSQLTNLGLTEMIAQTPQQYVEIAATLAWDLPRLAELRRTLRPRMQGSPLMDAPRFARNIEAAYRQMWGNWCAAGGDFKSG